MAAAGRKQWPKSSMPWKAWDLIWPIFRAKSLPGVFGTFADGPVLAVVRILTPKYQSKMNFKRFSLRLVAWLAIGGGALQGAPIINSFSPAFGSASDPTFIYISGSGFLPGALVVKFNGVTDTSAAVTDASGTMIQAHVPAGATNGINPIFVSVGGVGVFSVQNFTVIGPGPYISGFTPPSGGGGAGVTINGTHFTNPLTVKFNGVTAPGAATTDGTSISVNAPAGVTTGPITVTTTAGTYTTGTNFFVPPVITGFAPAFGRGGTNVLITGTNFLGATAVEFNGLGASGFTVLSNRALQATVPVGATTGLLRIITPAASVFSASNFVVSPTLSGFSPGFGPVGTSVVITGANLDRGTPVVKFNGVSAATPTGISFNQLTAVVPVGATTGPISITTADGSHTNAANFFLPARIINLNPNNSPPGSLVNLTGDNFIGVSAVTFNGMPAASFGVSNNNVLGAIVPAGVTTGPIGVTSPAGSTNSSSLFYAAPIISGFNPAHGLPGTNVILTGQNFLGATNVRFNGTNAASFVVSNNTTIRAVVQTGASTGPITVIAPAGTNTSPGNFILDYTANLSLTATDAPDPQFVGSNVVYTLTIQNAGPYNAPGVTLTNILPADVNLVSANTSQGTLNTSGNPITGSLGQLNIGGSIFVTLTVSAQTTGFITNLAWTASPYPDPATANNSATNGTLVQPIPKLIARRVAPNQVRLIWPAALTNYALEFKPAVNTNLWTAIATPPTLVGTENQLTETNTSPARFYRLHRRP